MKFVRFLMFAAFCAAVCSAQSTKPFLSNLQATRTSPLYATYAAQMERSEFALDEGYHFCFYDTARGADFTTDNAGDWALGFRKGSRYVWALKDMYSEPVITMSYMDIVKYTYYPFKDIRVDVTFLVQSSHYALQDVTVTNEGTERVSIEALPFLRNNHRAFSDVALLKEHNAIAFRHEEFPDGWVLEHGVPYVEDVHDVFMMSSPPDRMGSFRSYRWGAVEIPPKIDVRKQNEMLIYGRIIHAEGERCPHRPPVTTLTAFLNNDKSRLLTETAPRWGSMGSYTTLYGVDLGNFGPVKPGDTYSIAITCAAAGQDAVISGTVDTAKGRLQRVDAKLKAALMPKAPVDVRRDIWGSGTELRLYWKQGTEQVTYNVYRRDYLAGGIYELLASNLTQLFYTDKNLPEDKVYGYVVIAVDRDGRMSMHSNEVNNIEGSDFLTDVKYPGQVYGKAKDLARVVSMAKSFELEPRQSGHLRVVRGVHRATDTRDDVLARCRVLMNEDLEQYRVYDEKLYSGIPAPKFTSDDKTMMYWSAFTLMRQQMLPPEGKSSFNYYVFSREPQWGWGHGGQVFHESLTMLAYALMDPVSAMNSQRVYRERQRADGYINYRTGGFLDETIETNGQFTSSAPWYAWQNLEVYRLTKDRKFLEEMYRSSVAFHDYYVKNRDFDNDGLCEWGADGVLESVRDAYVAVWDQVGDPTSFEGVDVNAMLVMEEKSLAQMARELGLASEATGWETMAAERSRKINEKMWDEQTGFYYNIDKRNHTFTHKKENDLKREEIIGFLPLWAGIADKHQAERLVAKMTDPKKFWRMYGVPTLAADDPYYNPKGYWNGPVWVQWDFMLERGLLAYGYGDAASTMVERVASNMIAQLKKDHNFWEFYSPDDQWAGYNKTYIWAGIITRMMTDLQQTPQR